MKATLVGKRRNADHTDFGLGNLRQVGQLSGVANSRLLGRNRRHGFVDGGGNCFLFVLDGKLMKVSMGAADWWLRPLASMREGDRACILFL